jgi:hypothetical protein
MKRNFGNPFKIGTQNNRLLNRLCKGPVTNGEIVYSMYITRVSARIFEINEYLKLYGRRVTKRCLKKSVWVYGIRGI